MDNNIKTDWKHWQRGLDLGKPLPNLEHREEIIKKVKEAYSKMSAMEIMDSIYSNEKDNSNECNISKEREE